MTKKVDELLAPIIEVEKEESYQFLETAILCGLVNDPDNFYTVSDILRPQIFTEWRVDLAQAIWDFNDQGKFYDLITIQDELAKRINDKGESFQVEEFFELASGYSPNIGEYAERLIRRFYFKHTHECIVKAQEELISGEETEIVMSNLVSAYEEMKSWTVSTDKEDQRYLDLIIQLESGKKLGLQTLMEDYNRIAGGILPGDYVIVGAKPGMGKTTYAIQELLSQAKQGIPVALFSLEESKEALIQKFAAYAKRVDPHKLPQISRYPELLKRIVEGIQYINELPIYIYDLASVGMSNKIENILAKCRALIKRDGVQLISIDYLQLIRSFMRTSTREERLSEISYLIRIFARINKVAFLNLSQLNKDFVGIPTLDNLRESGSLAQDATDIWFPVRPTINGVKEDEMGRSFDKRTRIYIGKCRKNGEMLNKWQEMITDENKLLRSYDPDLEYSPFPDIPPKTSNDDLPTPPSNNIIIPPQKRNDDDDIPF